MRVYLHLSFVLFAVALVACAPASQAPVAESEADRAAVRAEIESLESQYSSAITSGDLEAILAIYSDDGAHLVPNQPAILGKSALRTLWEDRFAQNDYQTSTLVEGVRVSGDLAVSRIRMNGTVTPKNDSEPTLINLKGLTVWEKQSDGSWKRLWSTYNSNTPPAAPPETS